MICDSGDRNFLRGSQGDANNSTSDKASLELLYYLTSSSCSPVVSAALDLMIFQEILFS